MFAGRAWPAVPKPMPQEVFGSWLGRVAARFRIGVNDLLAAGELDIDVGQGAQRWLGAMPRHAQALARLGHLARLQVGELETMLAFNEARPGNYRCCFRCLVLNPAEVESPYWQLAWMEHKFTCEHGSSETESASPSMLVQARNMRKLVDALGRRRRGRARESGTLRSNRRC